MDLATFRKSLAAAVPPEGIEIPIVALWWDAKGDWNKAHQLADQRHDEIGSWVHAYLHRKEGDRGNASYWYRRAGKAMPSKMSAEEEWAAIASALVEKKK